jgi:homoaconitase/3-isopropylmalate dehydratase large subunit
MSGRTLFEKVWGDHVVLRSPLGEELLYVDFNMINEGQSFLASISSASKAAPRAVRSKTWR